MIEQLNFLITRGADWITRQRNRYRPEAVELPAEMGRALAPFFTRETLKSVRCAEVTQIENPDFYPELLDAGYEIPIEFREMAGVTFFDTVVIAREHSPHLADDALMFHECVHVVQYQVLGTAEFTRQYVMGWAENGCQYDAIPLERDAYDLQRRFEAAPEMPFSVEAEVGKRLT